MPKSKFKTSDDQGPHVALEPGAVRSAELLIHSWTEYGVTSKNRIAPESMPTAMLGRIARAVSVEAGNGTRGWPNFMQLFTQDESERLRFMSCIETPIAPEPLHCGKLIETLHEFHRTRETWSIAIELQKSIDNEQRNELVKKLVALDETKTRNDCFEFTHADNLVDSEGAFDFVENILTDGAASVIYGASNSGKTFFALDLAAHIATGAEWQEKEVEQGAVLYIALEGMQGAINRIKAMKIRKILPMGAPLFVSFSPVNLLDPTHPTEIIKLIQEVGVEAELSVRFVIIDTMARAMAGGDENSGEDMGRAVETIDAVRKETGAHVCIIHHSGKDAARGARGHSSLRAAIDTEIEVIHPEGDKYRTATVVKQRDLAPIPPLCFSLDPVEVGITHRGKPITSCVVKEEDSMMAHTKGKSGAKKRFTCEMILELLPQRDFKMWCEAAKETHGMSEDTFGDRRRECSAQWEKVGNQIILKPF